MALKILHKSKNIFASLALPAFGIEYEYSATNYFLNARNAQRFRKYFIEFHENRLFPI